MVFGAIRGNNFATRKEPRETGCLSELKVKKVSELGLKRVEVRTRAIFCPAQCATAQNYSTHIYKLTITYSVTP